MSYYLDGNPYRFSHSAFDVYCKSRKDRVTEFMHQMSGDLHVSVSAIKDWRHGSHEPSDLEKVEDIASYLDIEAEELLIKEKPMSNTPEPCKLNDQQLMSLYRVRAAILDFFELAEKTDRYIYKTGTSIDAIPAYLVVKIIPVQQSYVEDYCPRIDTCDLCVWAEEYVCNVFEKERLFLEKTPVYEPLSKIVYSYVAEYAWDENGNWTPDIDVFAHCDSQEKFERIPTVMKEAAAMKELDEILELCIGD